MALGKVREDGPGKWQGHHYLWGVSLSTPGEQHRLQPGQAVQCGVLGGHAGGRLGLCLFP